MKKIQKRYIILPILLVLVLAAVIVVVAVTANRRYLKKLNYDHVSGYSYNGVDIVGEDGLFYLVKDGKRVSNGYVSLHSVNDLYGEDVLRELAKTDETVVLFDYYLAKAAESSKLLLVCSDGSEYVIEGDSYSLDRESTRLPYLVFTNNENGLKSVISLHRLDSDVSYMSGNELTLRTFIDVIPRTVCDEDILSTYLYTLDVGVPGVADGTSHYSYFRNDGIKLATGTEVTLIPLYLEDEPERVHPFFYTPADGRIVSLDGEQIASGVQSIERAGATDWRYALCRNAETGVYYAVTFSPERSITLASDEYELSSARGFGNCIILNAADGSGVEVVNTLTSYTESYTSVTENTIILTAQSSNGTYLYLDKDGATVTKSTYSDMLPNLELSTDDCFVLSSASVGEEQLFFARSGSESYRLDTTDISVSLLPTEGFTAYLLTKTQNETQTYAVLAPFSVAKMSEYYDTEPECNVTGGVSWIKATDNARGVHEIIDPMTAKVKASFSCTHGDLENHEFQLLESIVLDADSRKRDTEININIITVSHRDKDALKNSIRYFALYRPAPIESDTFASAELCAEELGTNLLMDDPYSVYTYDNYLITNTASGSQAFSLDTSYALTSTAMLPYRITDILEDMETEEKYFIAVTDGGMCGVYSAASEIVLSPYYSEVLHVDNGYFTVKLRGAYGVVRSGMNGAKKVIDFLFSRIIPLGDNGYLAVDGEGTTCIYHGKKLIFSDPVQSYTPVTSFSVNDDGTLNMNTHSLLSIAGDLYIHKNN